MASPRVAPVSTRALRSGATSARFRVRSRGMVGWSINEFKSNFFNPQAVNSAVDAAAYKALAGMGSYARTVAKNLLRKKSTQYKSAADMPPALQEAYNARRIAWHKRGGDPRYEPRLFWKASPPGKPPFQRVGFLRKFLYYGVLRKQRSVYVGPAYLPNKGARTHTIPETHEYGRPNVGYLPKSNKRGIVPFPPRPYMIEAQKITLAQPMARWWKDKVRKPSRRSK